MGMAALSMCISFEHQKLRFPMGVILLAEVLEHATLSPQSLSAIRGTISGDSNTAGQQASRHSGATHMMLPSFSADRGVSRHVPHDPSICSATNAAAC
jgi:hypothetical protein